MKGGSYKAAHSECDGASSACETRGKEGNEGTRREGESEERETAREQKNINKKKGTWVECVKERRPVDRA